MPEAVEDLIEATTDKDGRAVIEAAANDEIAYVNVHAKGFGIQGRPFRPLTSQPKRVRLRPVASLEGRLQADDPAMVKGWRVFAYTYAGDRWSANAQTTGFDKGTTDAEGRFSFPVIAPGTLQLVVKPPGDLRVLADVPDSLTVTAGRSNSVVVPLRKTVTITGIVRERDTGRPVPGAEMHLSPAGGGMVQNATTDARGRYTYSCLPGKWHVSPSKLPPALIRAPGPPWKEITVSEGQGRLELEPWEALPAAPPLRFIVRDETGRPAAHASITGYSYSGWSYMPEAADDHGEFTIAGLVPGNEFSVEIRQGERMTDGPVKVMAGAHGAGPRQGPPGARDRAGGPRGRAGRHADPRCRGAAPVPREGGAGRRSPHSPGRSRPAIAAGIRTGTDGTFRTPKEIYRKNREFRVEVIAAGFFDGKTDWASADGGELITFPELALRPARRSVSSRAAWSIARGRGSPRSRSSSRVIRRRGRSRSPTPRVDSISTASRAAPPWCSPRRTATASAERSWGRVMHRWRSAWPRVEEPPISIPKPVPPPLPRAEERFLALELIAPLIDPARAGSLGQMGQAVVPALARVDPDRVLEMLENRVLPHAANVLQQVALRSSRTTRRRRWRPSRPIGTRPPAPRDSSHSPTG